MTRPFRGGVGFGLAIGFHDADQETAAWPTPGGNQSMPQALRLITSESDNRHV
jgi:hypothetical protein